MRSASFALAVPCLVGLLRISYTSSGWSQLEGESLSTVYFILQAKAEIPQQQQFQRLSGRHLGVTLRGNEFLRVPENAATSSPEPLPMHPRNLVRRMNGPARAHTVPEAPRGRGPRIRINIISFAIRQIQMNPTKPSFHMTMLYSYRDECTLNTNQL